MKLSAQDYLAKLYGSRALFKLLYEEGMSVLPPLVPEDDSDKHWPIESTRSMRDLAKLLSVSPSTVGIDMRRLENYSWLQRKGSRRVLGHRVRSRVHLMADVAAEAATGIKVIVSLDILGISPTVKDSEAEATEFQKGPGRTWQPDA